MFSLLTSGKRFGYHIGFQLDPIHLSGYSTLNEFFFQVRAQKILASMGTYENQFETT